MTEHLWPEFREAELHQAIRDFARATGGLAADDGVRLGDRFRETKCGPATIVLGHWPSVSVLPAGYGSLEFGEYATLLRWRLLLGTVCIAAFVALVWLDFRSTPGLPLLVLAMAVGLLAAQEVVNLLERAGYRPLPGVIYGGSLLVIASNSIPIFLSPAPDDQPGERLSWPLLAFALSLVAAFVGEMSRYRQAGGVIVNIALAMFGVAYVGVLLTFAIQLRMLGGPVTGMVLLLALIIVVKLADTGAIQLAGCLGGTRWPRCSALARRSRAPSADWRLRAWGPGFRLRTCPSGWAATGRHMPGDGSCSAWRWESRV